MLKPRRRSGPQVLPTVLSNRRGVPMAPFSSPDIVTICTDLQRRAWETFGPRDFDGPEVLATDAQRWPVW